MHTFFIAVLLFAATALPDVYYIDIANGQDTNNGKTLQSAWKTIGKANKSLLGGDTVLIKGGIYPGEIEPANSGTSQKPIVYRNYGTEQVRLSGFPIAVRITGRQFITVTGIIATQVDRYVHIDSSNHVCIQDCRFDSANSTAGWPMGVQLRKSSRHNTIRGCTICRAGYCTVDDDKGGVMNIGVWEDTADHCDSNLVENNLFFFGGHHIIELVGRYNVIRNNYFHNEEWMACTLSQTGGKCGNRLIIAGYDPRQCNRNLIEGNRFAFSGVPPDGNTSAGISVRVPGTIIRNNVFYCNDGPGLDICTMDSTYDARFNKVYHNSFYHNGHTLLPDVEKWKQGGMLVAKHGNSTPATRIAIKNNIFYDDKTDAIVFYYVSKDSQDVKNNWEHAGDPLFEDIQTPIDPENPRVPDLRLKAASPCIDSGAFLTFVTSAGGAGTQFKVADAGYFTNGWGVITGDIIQMKGSLQRAGILDVDYNTNTITVDIILTWSQGQGVALAFQGSAPDMGAYEYTQTSIKNSTGKILNLASPQIIHPNPLRTERLRRYLQANKNWELYDITGKKVTKAALKNSGVYLLKLGSAQFFQKVITIQ